ncbi:MAG: flagellar basal body-associated FliL family protein [Roseomonas sp.]|nr:flagellar basal body-associated FliL family protein [Roseomonas sp.]
MPQKNGSLSFRDGEEGSISALANDPLEPSIPQPPRAARRRWPWFLLAALVVLAGLAAGGAWHFKLGPFQPQAAEGPPAAVILAPVLVDMPEIITNLNAGNRRPVYVKMRARIELARARDMAAVQASMPRLMDSFTTFLRETRPEELRGSAGIHRLREELIARSNILLRPGTVTDVLFVELVVQ